MHFTLAGMVHLWSNQSSDRNREALTVDPLTRVGNGKEKRVADHILERVQQIGTCGNRLTLSNRSRLSYRVTLWRDMHSETASGAEIVKWYMSMPQALHGMRKLAYAKLESFAKLDTVAAHKVMGEIDACNDILPKGESRCVTISNTGYSLTLTNK